MFGIFGPKSKEEAIQKILYYQSQPAMYSGVVPYEKEINQLKDKFNIDDGEIEQARKKVKEKKKKKESEGIEKKRGEVLLGGKNVENQENQENLEK